ncbi:hypothetical protein [Desulfuribacillus alkaliarsenatis]|nr:hypothetical protein [Desulfuribacillus alkaliarsenatis]
MIEIVYIIMAFIVGHFIGSKGWRRFMTTSRKKQPRTFVTAKEREMLLK